MNNNVFSALMEQRKMQLQRGWLTDVNIDGYENFVFSTKHKNPIMPNAINNLLLNIENAIKKRYPDKELRHVSAHILRHTACTRMAETGMDPKVLQGIMGHSDISITMKFYNHNSDERTIAELERVENMLFSV